MHSFFGRFQFRLVWLFLLTLVVAASVTVSNNYHFPVDFIPGWLIGPATILVCVVLGLVVNWLLTAKSGDATGGDQTQSGQ